LENWFSLIRGKGGCRDNPTSSQYESASKNVAVNWVLDKPESGRNCERDIDDFVGILTHLVHKRSNTSKEKHQPHTSRVVGSTNIPPVASSTSCNQIELLSDTSSFDRHAAEKNIVCYISGFIAMKNSDVIKNCDICYRDVFMDITVNGELTSDYLFITLKNYDWARNGLTAPSYQLLEVCSVIEKHLKIQLPANIHLQNVLINLFNSASQIPVVMEFLKKKCHKEIRCKIVMLYIKLRIYHFIHITNQENKSLSQLRKRKKNCKRFVTNKKKTRSTCITRKFIEFVC
jgi:hypothetical protein